MNPKPIAFAAALAVGAVLALPAAGAMPPSRMMANVYLLAEAGAMLDICLASPAYEALPPEQAGELQGLATRLATLVRSIGSHYGDADLEAVFKATKARLSAEPGVKLHVRNNFEYCGERLVDPLRAYVAENEGLMARFFKDQALRTPAK